MALIKGTRAVWHLVWMSELENWNEDAEKSSLNATSLAPAPTIECLSRRKQCLQRMCSLVAFLDSVASKYNIDSASASTVTARDSSSLWILQREWANERDLVCMVRTNMFVYKEREREKVHASDQIKKRASTKDSAECLKPKAEAETTVGFFLFPSRRWRWSSFVRNQSHVLRIRFHLSLSLDCRKQERNWRSSFLFHPLITLTICVHPHTIIRFSHKHIF